MKKTFFQVLSSYAMPLLTIAISSIFTSCEKQLSLNQTVSVAVKIVDADVVPMMPFSPSQNIHQCIYSYTQLVRELMTNSISIESVMLSDGTTIHKGNGVVSMTYTASDLREVNSLFQSRFEVLYNLYGYQQENTTNCWTLGCTYINTGLPPFTNIIKGGKLLLINTSFFWGVPGMGLGKHIDYLVIK